MFGTYFFVKKQRTTMDLYEKIDLETKELILAFLRKRTLVGKQVWKNMHYNQMDIMKEMVEQTQRVLEEK